MHNEPSGLDAFGRPVFGGVQGPEARTEPGGVQRRAQHAATTCGTSAPAASRPSGCSCRSTVRIKEHWSAARAHTDLKATTFQANQT
jgi:hypothetical protein